MRPAFFITAAVIVAATTAGTAMAAGIQRSVPSTRVLFEEGRFLELSAGYFSPDLSGSGGLLAPGASTGDLLDKFFTIGAAYKADLNDQLSYALIFDDPWGVDTQYPMVAGSGYSGTSATLDSYGLTGILAWDFNENFKAYAGIRAQSVEASALFPFGAALGLAGPYDVKGRRDYGLGYMAGVAYERPEIALRVALTYYSEIETDLATTETIGGVSTRNSTDVTTPQAVNLEFQTGIMEDTLLFGSVRWVDWSDFSIAPPEFTAGVGAPLVDYQKDWITYTLGVGRKLSDQWSVGLQGSWEPATDTTLTTLGPVDGRWSVSAGATYRMESMKITGGVTYVDLGEAQNFAATEFGGGSAIGAGVRLGFYF